MKKIILVFLIGLFLGSTIWSTPIVHPEDSHYIKITIHHGESIYNVSITIPKISFNYINMDNGSFTIINYPNGGESTVIGDANLPKMYPLIEVPSLEVSSIIVSNEKWDEISLSDMDLPYMVYPVQPSMVKSNTNLSQNFVINYSYYSQDVFTPSKTVRILEKGTFRGINCILLELSPVKYNPIKGDIKILDSCKIDIYLSEEDTERDIIPHKNLESKTFDRLLSTIILNYNYSTKNYPRESENYLIITYDDFYSEILSFAEWKQEQGYIVTIVNTSLINENLTSKELREFIKTVYNTWSNPPVYILLVGDVEEIPTFIGEHSMTATDLYYTLMDNDFFPDILIGRFPASNKEQVSIMVNKTILYEQGRFSQCYIKHAVFLASMDKHYISEGTHNYVIEQYMIPHNFSCDKLYRAAYKATTQQVIDVINEGRGLIVYSGHGSPAEWADGPKFTQNDIRNLRNHEIYPFICSHACLTGKFNFWECFGETWLRVPDKGAVAFWGSSAPTMWTEDDLLEKYMFSAWWDYNIRDIGGMTSSALEQLYTHYGGGKNSKYYMECYNILGDPSMKLWENNPLTADFRFQQISDNKNFTISFYDNSYGCINSIKWDFGDNTTSRELNPIHHYIEKKSYDITLTVENKDGNMDIIERKIIPIDIIYPLENGLYVFGVKILNIEKTIIIGPLIVKVETYNESDIDHIEFLVDNISKDIVYQQPFTFIWNEKSFGKHDIKVIAYENNGMVFDTKEDIFIVNL